MTPHPPDLRSIARTLGGEVAGHQVLAPGPNHSPQDRSLSVRLDARAPGGFLVYSFAGDDPLAAKDYVRSRLGLVGSAEPAHTPVPAASDTDRTTRALSLWEEARNPRATPVEVYLARRGLMLDIGAGDAIRCHPHCPFADRRTPAMLCLVRDVVTDAPKAIHRTALTLDGRKGTVAGHDRLTLGPIKGGAVKFTPDADVSTCLGVGEGIETTLSLRLTPEFGPSPVWSLVSAGGINNLPVLAGIEALWIAVDHDPAGTRAARLTANRWRDAGADVFLVKPVRESTDLNDLVETLDA